ncbi:MAG: hypothetical protein AB8F95_14205 [Bacteroidia bacterium]
MRKFKYSIYLIFGVLCFSQMYAQRPPKALLGITAGGMILPGGDGLLFQGTSNQAHRTWGWATGISLYRSIGQDLHLNIAGLIMEEQSFMRANITGQGFSEIPFAYRALHGSITLNHQGSHLRRPWALKEFAGFGFNVGNLLQDPVATRFGSDIITTTRTQTWRIDPEFIVGAGMVSKMTEWGAIHYSVSLHMDLFENQQYQASLRRDGEIPLTVVRAQRDINIMLTATYFIRVPKKQNTCYQR